MALTRRDTLILGGVGIAAALAGAILGPRLLRPDAPLEVLEGARLTDLEGRTRQIGEWKGKALVCNFWATWCPPCREEIPLLVASHKEVLQKGGEIVGIALDTAKNVVGFEKIFQVTYPVLLAEPSAIDLMTKLGNPGAGLPYTLFIDRTGGLVGRKLGRLHGPELRDDLIRLLGT
jgi:thiol-disulfide isomerase/thioredoxin